MDGGFTCAQGHLCEAPGTCPQCGAPVEAIQPPVESAPDAGPTLVQPKRENGAAPLPPGVNTPGSPSEQATLLPQTVPASPAAPGPPVKVPGYEILSELGRGGMGVVYKARQVSLSRVVALKMILGGGHAGDLLLARFRAEAEAVACLRHPHIVQIYEIGEHQGLAFFSLEFVEGGSLAERLDGAPLPGRRAAHLVETLARAMHVAHQAGIVHRDLKPGNVLLTADGQPKITDFGLVKRLDRDSAHTQTGTILGTPSYMSPEQAGQGTRAVGPLSDVYSLGAILYELLTGRPPFRAANPLDTVLQVVAEEPVPPSRLNSKVPRDLETVCLKCLQKDPAKRYASAVDLADDLHRFLENEPIRARPVGRVERLGRWCRRNPAVASLLAAVALALLVGTGVSLFFALQAGNRAHEAEGLARLAREEQRSSERRLYVADLRLAQHTWEQGDVDRLRELLAGQVPERTSGLDLRGFEWYYWANVCQPDAPAVAVGRPWPVNAVAFHPDGRRLATGSQDTLVRLWDLETGTVSFLRGHTGSVNDVAFSADGRWLASAGQDRAVLLWEGAGGRKPAAFLGSSPVRCVAFSPDGRWLAAGDTQGVRLWDLATRQQVRTLTGHSGAVRGVAFSPDSRQLASASLDKTVKLWDLAAGQEVLTFTGHTQSVASVAFSPNGSLLASAGWDQTVRVWDRGDGHEVCRRDRDDAVTGVRFSPDSSRVACACREGKVEVWDLPGDRVITLEGHTNSVTRVAFSPDGRRLASASWDKTVKLWDLATRTLTRTLGGREGPVPDPAQVLHQPKEISGLAFRPDGRQLASISWDKTVRLWDVASGQPITPALVQEEQWIRCIAYGPAGRWLAWGSWDGTVTLWDLAAGRKRGVLRGHVGSVRDLTFSPDGRRLASGGDDGRVILWDVETGGRAGALSGHTRAVTGVRFSPINANRLASVSEDQTAIVWDVGSARPAHRLTGHTDTISGVAYRPDGRELATASLDRTIKLWNRDGRLVATLEGHALGVNSVAYSPDGGRLVSGSDDETVKVWDVAGGQETLTLQGHTNAVTMVAFSPEGGQLVSASKDKTLRVWQAPRSQDGPR